MRTCPGMLLKSARRGESGGRWVPPSAAYMLPGDLGSGGSKPSSKLHLSNGVVAVVYTDAVSAMLYAVWRALRERGTGGARPDRRSVAVDCLGPSADR